MKSLAISPKSFDVPHYLAPSAWSEHIPFAFWLIENLRPTKIVELGVHYGVSYFSFCQAVKSNGLPAICYAIDNWIGDSHAGFYDNSVFDTVNVYNKENYSGFSYLLRADFEQALSYFEEGSIDLLHIDGLHTYEAVKNDFEKWFPKLSKSSIVLFHDIVVRENNFGVYKLWAELSVKFPSFSFFHDFGLGVLATGSDIPIGLSFLFNKNLPDNTKNEIRSIYHRLGNSFSDKLRITEFGHKIDELSKEFDYKRKELQTDLLEKEKYIQELAAWSKNLAEEIIEKDKIIDGQKKTLFDQSHFIKDLEKEKMQLLEKKLTAQKGIEQLKEQLNNSHHLTENLKKQVSDYSIIIEEQKQKIHYSNQELDVVNERLKEIYNSEGWKLLKRYYNLKGRLLPEDSKRYKFLKRIVNKIRGKKNEKQFSSPVTILQEKQLNIDKSILTFETIEFPAFEQPMVSIIIPAFNGWHMNYKCLHSIKKNTFGVSYEVIFADDASIDETKNIKNYIKNITVVRNEKNMGFLKNCNHAATFAKGDYIHFLNNDTEVTSGWLSALSELMNKDSQIGLAGSKLVYPDGRLQEAGGIIWQDASGWNFGHGQDPEAPEFNYVKEVDYISGASIMVRKNVWQKLGGFDERFSPAYCEDTDLAFEIREMKMRVVYQPLSVVIHHEGFSHGSENDKNSGITNIKSYQEINDIKFAEKWQDVLLQHFPNGYNVFHARDRSAKKKTILVIDHYVPHFDKDAGSRTVFQYLKLFVALDYNVKFIGDNFYRQEPYTAKLQQMGIEVLYGSWYADNWQKWIQNNHDKFDFILLNRPHISLKYIDFIKENTRAKIFYYGHDLHFIRELKQYEIEKNPKLLESSKKWKKKETYIFDHSDIILAPSDEETKEINSIIGENKAKTILPYFFENFSNPVLDFSKRKNILFVGGFTHNPNVDAVLWFCNEIWPYVKSEITEAKFIVVGSNTPEQILRIASEDIIIKGYLTDEQLEQIYSSTKIIVVPLRYGAGVKGKTVEAMHKGIPLVTTSFGVEGLPGNTSFLIPQNTASGFSMEVVRLYSEEDELVNFSKAEIKYIQNYFSEDQARKDMIQILNELERVKV